MRSINKNHIKVGIIGAGRISDLHAIEYINNPYTQIVAICDSNNKNAVSRQAVWQAKEANIFDDYNELLAQPEIDLVEILVPHHLHKEIGIKAIEANKIVSLQKPMSLNLSDADELISAVKSSDTICKIFENFIFYPPVQRAKKLITAGAIGEPITIRIKSNPGNIDNGWEIPASAAQWRQETDKIGGGPVVFDDGHHKFALAWFFMGQAEMVHSWIGETVSPQNFVYDAPAMVSFKFSGNRYGNLEVVYSKELEILTKHYAQDDRVEITGSKGVIWINQGHGSLGNPPPVTLYRDGKTNHYWDMETGWESSFVHSTRHFIEAIRNGGKPKLTVDEGREVLEFTLAAQESAKRNTAVSIGN